ncbi:MAG: hypothetical protein Q8N14_07325, partial [Candidatus Omnitrophota bacterium]|nr:hypothetical protein [Candidatus Omnitrophota bacterium]
TPDNQPIIDSRKAETNLLVRNNETIIIGGLRKKEDSLTIEKVPFLGDIPLLGVFFRKKVSAVVDVDLLIFVTPRIVTEPKLTEREKDRLEGFYSSPEEESKLDRYYKKTKVKPQPIKSLGSVKEEPVKKEEDFYLRPPS